MAVVAGRGRLRRLQIVLVGLVFLSALAAAAYGSLTLFADVFVLRQRPIQSYDSPDGRWLVRVYEAERDVQGAGSWLATVGAAGGGGGRERVIWRGAEASFSWTGAQVLGVRERVFPLGEEQRIDVVGTATLRPWDGRGPFARFFVLLPALILLYGVPAAILLPPVLVHRAGRA